MGVLACDELHVAMATLVVVSFIVFVMGSLTSGDGNDGVALWMGRWGWRASVFLVLLFVLVRLRAWAVGGKGRWWALVRALGLDEAWVWGVGGVVLAGFGVEYDRLAPWHFQAVVLCLAGLGWIGLGFAELVRSCWGEEVAGMFWDAEGWCWRWFSEPFSLFRKIPVVPVADETPVADEAPVVELPGGVLARWLDMQCGPGGGPEPRGTVVEAERIRQAVSES